MNEKYLMSQITSRFEGTDSRKLRCASCRLHFRDRGIRTVSVQMIHKILLKLGFVHDERNIRNTNKEN